MTLGIAIAGFVATVAAAFGGAWYGGRLQRSANLETLARQVQIDSAAKFLAAVGDAMGVFGSGIILASAGRDNPTSKESAQHTWRVLVGLRVQASSLAIVGPDDLAKLARDIQGHAAVVDYSVITGNADQAQASQLEVGRLAEAFEAKATELLRPAAQQMSHPTSEQNDGQKDGGESRSWLAKLSDRVPWNSP